MKKTNGANPDDLVEFSSFQNVADAYIAKGILETNGVQCVVNGQLMSTLYYGVPGLDARLYVRQKDLALARRIIDSDHNTADDPIDPDQP